MKERVTLSLDQQTARYLADQAAAATAGNISAYVDQHFRSLALVDSVRRHVAWYVEHPGQLEADQAERDAA